MPAGTQNASSLGFGKQPLSAISSTTPYQRHDLHRPAPVRYATTNESRSSIRVIPKLLV